ncbi:MAG TPA: ribonuclease J [Candidatus Kryptonia bacterium]|nr:ribonuclease J [Candidatus Kryptonia bacterium]
MTPNGSGPLRVVPLGGLGEIGLNCLVLEYGDCAIAIDCGLMFPETHMLGIDLVIPDFSYLQHLGERFLGFVVTHGHEDHIGALPYALRDLHAPVYAPPMAAGLVREKLKEHKLDGEVALHVIEPRHTWQLGPFAIEAMHVTHSIVDAVALGIRTPLGTVIHTGDFKLDQTPLDGRRTDLQRLGEYGAEGVLLLMSDSTNVEREGITPSERSVRDGIDRIFRDTPGKVFFSTFSSHVHRLQQVLELAQVSGRRVVVVGRSLTNSIQIATELGHLRYPPGLFADVTALASIDPSQVTVLTTGSQGEALSALVRIAMGDHGQVKMQPGDAVVLSSRIIPGNEKTISNLINHMYRRGATVHHARSAEVHVSGHASQEELKMMVALTRPRYFVPVHGEYRHLARHRALAQSMGVPEDQTFLLEDGHVLEIDPDGAHVREPIGAGRVFVDGKGIGDVSDIVLRDRRHLSQDGLVLAVLALDQHSGELINGPDLVTRGFIFEEDGSAYLEQARAVVRDALAQITPESRTDSLEVKEEVRKALKRYFARTLDRRPVILPFIMEM